MDTVRLCANTLRGLAIDGVEAARSGHPGMPLGMADVAAVLWTRFLKHDPADPLWADRDRFVLSAGHGSMLIYGLLHLSGYDLSLDDLRQFRQKGSRTPGHPEYGHTAGVETTTGPLGQGFANGVGMALAERMLNARFGSDLVDHFTYAIVSDGDLMEGVASEAASIAGHLGLGRLIYLYDDNQISIDGSTEIAFTEDVLARFAAYGWHVQAVDGHDPVAIEAAIVAAREETGRPSIIRCRTRIGYGSPLAGSEKSHGAPLGAANVRATKEALGLDPDASFAAPDAAYTAFRAHDGAARRAAWAARLADSPHAAAFHAQLAADPAEILASVRWPSFEVGKGMATRKTSQACLRALMAAAPQIMGGSADLTESNGVDVARPAVTPASFAGPVVNFGVREHAMASMCNGMALHGGIIPYNATFLVFHDYMRPAVRLSALMNLGVVYVYSHDSVFLGEDGPTHQPIETLAALRLIPRLHVWRPADGAETVDAWKAAVSRRSAPTALVLTRQNLPELARPAGVDASRGAWMVRDGADVTVVATGSEVALALAAADLLAARGIEARVVSMPCRELFLAQSAAWRDALVPRDRPRCSVEAAVAAGWERVIGDGVSISIEDFGMSAPMAAIAESLGFVPSAVADRIAAALAR
jgi:transketolase